MASCRKFVVRVPVLYMQYDKYLEERCTCIWKKHGGHPNRQADYSDLETRHVHCKIAEDPIPLRYRISLGSLKILMYRDIRHLRAPDI